MHFVKVYSVCTRATRRGGMTTRLAPNFIC